MFEFMKRIAKLEEKQLQWTTELNAHKFADYEELCRLRLIIEKLQAQIDELKPKKKSK